MYLKSGTVCSVSESLCVDVDADRAFRYFLRPITWIGYTSRPLEMSAHKTLSSGSPVMLRICALNAMVWAHGPLWSAIQSAGVSSALFVMVRLAPCDSRKRAIRVLPLRQAICLVWSDEIVKKMHLVLVTKDFNSLHRHGFCLRKKLTRLCLRWYSVLSHCNHSAEEY